MKFFKDVKDSIYDPGFYQSLPTQKLESSISYFFKFIFLISLIEVILLAFPIFIGVSTLTNKVLPELVNKFPANLSVTIKDGQVLTNAHEPYAISLPQSQEDVSQPKNLMVINTKDPYTSAEFSKFDTVSLLTRDTLFVLQSGQGIRAFPLNNVKNITIDRQHLNATLNRFSPLAKFFVPVILFLILIALFFFYMLRLVYLVFLAIIISLISRIIKPELSFSSSYKVGLHAMTLGILIEAGLTILSPVLHLHGFEFMVTIISVLIYIVNFKHADSPVVKNQAKQIKPKSTAKSTKKKK